MITLGRLKIRNPLILAPMSMYSDYPFRQICRDYGASYAVTELFHADKFIAKKDNEKRFDFYEKDLGLQLLTKDPAELKKAIEMINNREFYPRLENINSIDLNVGCPTPEVIRQGKGAALLLNPEKVRPLFKVMVKHSDFPVSAKIRLGVDMKNKKSKPYLKIAKIAEQENIDYITIHARTASQAYTEPADFEAIKETVRAVNIPVVGNGGIHNEKTAEKMLKQCPAIMIGLGAVYNPFIFEELDHYLKTGKKMNPDRLAEKKKCIVRYFELSEKYDVGFQHIKIHMQGFLKGIPDSQQTINALTHTKNIEEIKSLMQKF